VRVNWTGSLIGLFLLLSSLVAGQHFHPVSVVLRVGFPQNDGDLADVLGLSRARYGSRNSCVRPGASAPAALSRWWRYSRGDALAWSRRRPRRNRKQFTRCLVVYFRTALHARVLISKPAPPAVQSYGTKMAAQIRPDGVLGITLYGIGARVRTRLSGPPA
jgi:hypothetical protein